MKIFVFTLLFLILMIVFSFGKAEAVEDIVLALSFEEVEGEVVKDLSPHGNDGTLMGDPKQVDGKIGKALEFDGDDYIDLGDNKFLFPEVTVVFWANKIGSGADCCPTYFVIRDAAANACGIFFAAPPKTLRVFFYKPNGIGEQTLVQKGTTEDDDWHHIAGVFSATSGRKLYIDGNLNASSDSFRRTPADLDETNTYIARGRTLNPIEYVVGAFDEFLVVKGVLTKEEIQRHMNEGVEGVLAVRSSGKLTITWASIKESK